MARARCHDVGHLFLAARMSGVACQIGLSLSLSLGPRSCWRPNETPNEAVRGRRRQQLN